MNNENGTKFITHHSTLCQSKNNDHSSFFPTRNLVRKDVNLVEYSHWNRSSCTQSIMIHGGHGDTHWGKEEQGKTKKRLDLQFK